MILYLDQTIVLVIHIFTIYLFLHHRAGWDSWNLIKKSAFCSWSLSGFVSIFEILAHSRAVWVPISICVGSLALFLIFFDDDFWNKKRKRSRVGKFLLRAKAYLAYGVEAKRPVPDAR